MEQVLPFPEADLSDREIWQMLYSKLFISENGFHEDFKTFEKKLQKIMPVLVQRFPQLREDLVYQLLVAKKIPEFLYEDEGLSQLICPITDCPIFEPFKEKGTNHIYEKKALLAWIREHGSSPMTGNQVTRDDFYDEPYLKKHIDLQFLQLKMLFFYEKVGLQEEEDHLRRFLDFCAIVRRERATERRIIRNLRNFNASHPLEDDISQRRYSL